MGGATCGGESGDGAGADDERPAAAQSAGPPPVGAYRDYFVMLLYRIPTPIAVCRADGEVLIANPAMAEQWGAVPGQLRGRNLLDRFRPRDRAQVARVMEALRLGRRSRYPVEVRWRTAPGEPERQGELTIDPVGDPSADPPALLALLRVHEPTAPPPAPRAATSPVEARILALAAGGATTAAIGGALGLTVDGVNYHLTRLARRWRVQGRTALVARAYVLGVLDPDHWPPAPAVPGGGDGPAPGP
ncbi:PAS domain-containing protein (plasmid) [Streptomyces sp. BHT-5-2]|uniref:PAS domain-containing protein n=1 Tax=unclassified Streptomyces TaxID=2593676 RepID=UPI001C8E922C|nr:PAS domain-containing protein [Streptomyces sp. BHT-5-2]QZL07184.1 PAS domain-containing protein [Streptomyces sp. BHT-5-2]